MWVAQSWRISMHRRTPLPTPPAAPAAACVRNCWPTCRHERQQLRRRRWWMQRRRRHAGSRVREGLHSHCAHVLLCVESRRMPPNACARGRELWSWALMEVLVLVLVLALALALVLVLALVPVLVTASHRKNWKCTTHASSNTSCERERCAHVCVCVCVCVWLCGCVAVCGCVWLCVLPWRITRVWCGCTESERGRHLEEVRIWGVESAREEVPRHNQHVHTRPQVPWRWQWRCLHCW